MNQLLPFLASTINGISFGGLVFVGAVDVRAFLAVLSSVKGESIIKELFPIWWPCGRDLMAPVGILGALLNFSIHLQQRKKLTNTSNVFGLAQADLWLVPAAMHFAIVMWTGSVMGSTIRHLMSAKDDQFREVFKTFCSLHFPRILFSGIASTREHP